MRSATVGVLTNEQIIIKQARLGFSDEPSLSSRRLPSGNEGS